MEYWRSSSKKNVPNQAIAIRLLHYFFPLLGFSGPVIKKEKLLAKLREPTDCISGVLSAA